MKHILLATDLSARSDRALTRAGMLAGQHKASLTVLHVIGDNRSDPAWSRAAAKAERELAASTAALVPAGGPPAELVIAAGNPFETICRTAETTDCDVIVLGRHRNEDGGTLFSGTTIGHVLQAAPRPVLVVLDRPLGTYRRVVVGVDYSDFSRRAVQCALALAPGSAINAVHAYEVPFEGFMPGAATHQAVLDVDTQSLDAFIAATTGGLAGVDAVQRRGGVTGVLRREIAETSGDLLVVGTHGRTGLAGAILGSVARDLLERPPCDILVVPGDRKSGH